MVRAAPTRVPHGVGLVPLRVEAPPEWAWCSATGSWNVKAASFALRRLSARAWRSFAPPALGECSHSGLARCRVPMVRRAIPVIAEGQGPHPRLPTSAPVLLLFWWGGWGKSARLALHTRTQGFERAGMDREVQDGEPGDQWPYRSHGLGVHTWVGCSIGRPLISRLIGGVQSSGQIWFRRGPANVSIVASFGTYEREPPESWRYTELSPDRFRDFWR